MTLPTITLSEDFNKFLLDTVRFYSEEAIIKATNDLIQRFQEELNRQINSLNQQQNFNANNSLVFDKQNPNDLSIKNNQIENNVESALQSDDQLTSSSNVDLLDLSTTAVQPVAVTPNTLNEILPQVLPVTLKQNDKIATNENQTLLTTPLPLTSNDQTDNEFDVDLDNDKTSSCVTENLPQNKNVGNKRSIDDIIIKNECDNEVLPTKKIKTSSTPLVNTTLPTHQNILEASTTPSTSKTPQTKTNLTENDTNENTDYNDDDTKDRWTSDKLTNIKVIEIMCYKKQCKQMCKTQEEYDKHLLSAHNLQPFNCLIDSCNTSFANKSTWKEHVIKIHKNSASNYICRYCKQKFTKLQALFKHYILFHEKGTFVCSICNYTSSLRVNVFNHIKLKHPLKSMSFMRPQLNKQEFSFMKIISLNCLHCSNEFSSETEIYRHVEAVHHIKKYACYAKKCKISFDDPTNLEDHLKHSHENLQCSYCPKIGLTTHIDDLKFHTLFYHQKGQFECTLCDHRPLMNTRAAFKEHCKIIHYKKDQNLINPACQQNQVKPPNTKFKCLFCSCTNSYDSEYQLENHVERAHKTENSWLCKHCEYQTSSHKELSFHVNLQHSHKELKNENQDNTFIERRRNSAEMNNHIPNAHPIPPFIWPERWNTNDYYLQNYNNQPFY